MITKRNPSPFDVLKRLFLTYEAAQTEYENVIAARASSDIRRLPVALNFDELVNKWRTRVQRLTTLACGVRAHSPDSEPSELCMIAAMDKNGLIGDNGALPWQNKEEMAQFRRATMGTTVIMGRKTAESIGKQLPGRLNFVVTSSHLETNVWSYQFDSYERAVAPAKQLTQRVFLIGGRSAYEWGLSRATKAILSVMHDVCERGENAVFWPHPAASLSCASTGEQLYCPLPEGWVLDTRLVGLSGDFHTLYAHRDTAYTSGACVSCGRNDRAMYDDRLCETCIQIEAEYKLKD